MCLNGRDQKTEKKTNQGVGSRPGTRPESESRVASPLLTPSHDSARDSVSIVTRKLQTIWIFLTWAVVIGTAVPATAQNTSQTSGAWVSQSYQTMPAFAELAERVLPSVVNISTRQRLSGVRGSDVFRGQFEQFFGFQMPRGSQPVERPLALGTGAVIRSEGQEAWVLTNLHVIDGASKVEVQFADSVGIPGSVEAKVVGQDADLDLALLKVKTQKSVPALDFGSSEALRVGEYVIAVGNPFGQGHSVTHGIISAKGRVAPTLLGRYLQTDAPINPGNSGGPLINMHGQIIGINNAVLAQAQGIGFAIPSDDIVAVLPQLMSEGKVSRGFLGIRMDELRRDLADSLDATEAAPGAPLVVAVDPRGPAQRAGVKPYDVILKVNGKEVRSTRELITTVSALRAGSKAELEILRDGERQSVRVTLTERPKA